MFEKFYFDILSLKTEMQFRNYSISTQDIYCKTVKEFLETTGKEVIDITRSDIIRFLDERLKTVHVNTILVMLNALEFFFKEILGIDVADNIRKYKRQFKTKDFLSEEQLNILTSSIPSRERLFCNVIIETGMMVEEVIELKITDLLLTDDVWTLGGYEISKDLATDITDYTERNYLQGYIFTLSNGEDHILNNTARHWLRTYTKDVLGKVYTFNDIRHSVALEMIKKGYEKEATAYLRNKSVNSVRQFYRRAGYDYYYLNKKQE